MIDVGRSAAFDASRIVPDPWAAPPDPRHQFVVDVMICSNCIEARVRGELDPATAPELERKLVDVIVEQRPDQVVVDLADLTFMDSSGIKALVRLRAMLVGSGSHLVLQRPRDAVCRVLELAGLRGFFDVGSERAH
jgi:stage II sporulation protein AA (anti-sigma F factor antagonist)